jgi:hypothetical protein
MKSKKEKLENLFKDFKRFMDQVVIPHIKRSYEIEREFMERLDDLMERKKKISGFIEPN